MERGKVTFVGTGIRGIAQITREAKTEVAAADVTFFGVTDPFTQRWIEATSKDARPLDDLYREGLPRWETYRAMSERILSAVRDGGRICVCFEGHPGMFVSVSALVRDRAAREGHAFALLPGVSALDCLFADLLIDPADDGCQSFEATDFLVYRRNVDVRTPLVLWQADAVGEPAFRRAAWDDTKLAVLAERFTELYGPAHPLVIYRAASLVVGNPTIRHTTIDGLQRDLLPGATLFIPPAGRPAFNQATLLTLGLDPERPYIPLERSGAA